MNENNTIKNYSLETIGKTVLSEQTKFRLSEIIGIENYFYQEIDQRKSCSKKSNKYVTTFDYIDKIYIIYKYYWSTSWNSKCKSYFSFFLNNWNS